MAINLFVSDQLSQGRRFRVLNVVDDYSRECIWQLAAVTISGERVTPYLSTLCKQHGKLTQKAFVESFNGKFRHTCLNQHW